MKKIIIFGVLIISSLYMIKVQKINIKETEFQMQEDNKPVVISNTQFKRSEQLNNIQIDDWRLTLVNYENSLPEDFEIELANIDKTRQFDKRAIDELFSMMKSMKNDGIYNIWVQSAYRSVTYQQELFDTKINKYMKMGKTKEEAERLTLQTINKPGTSEHHLGLAVDFNFVDYSFDESKGFYWLKENAEKYGFILRYRKDKEDITKVNYEPWHWRYVGREHAKKLMN